MVATASGEKLADLVPTLAELVVRSPLAASPNSDTLPSQLLAKFEPRFA